MPVGSKKALHWLFATISAWIVIFVLRYSSLGGVWRPISTDTVFVIMVWLTAYTGGYALAMRPLSVGQATTGTPDVSWFNLWIVSLSFAAVIGATTIIYEFAVLRGYGFSTPVEEIRQSEVLGAIAGISGSGFSGIGRLFVPALPVAWILAILRPAPLSKIAWLFLICATAVVLWQQTVFEGGRIFLATLLISNGIARSLRKTTIPQRRSHGLTMSYLPAAMIALVALVLFGSVFVERLNARNVDLADGYQAFTDSFAIDVPYSTIDRLQGEGATIRFAAYMFWMYVTQGPNQFDELLEQPLLANGYGALEFGQISRAITMLSGINFNYSPFENMPTAGAYTTFLGESYMDFGIPMIWLFAALLGYFTCRSARTLMDGQVTKSSFCAPFLITIGIFSPIVNLVINLWPAIAIAASVGFTARVQAFPSLPRLAIKARQ
jgi:hypothetical protein